LDLSYSEYIVENTLRILVASVLHAARLGENAAKKNMCHSISAGVTQHHIAAQPFDWVSIKITTPEQKPPIRIRRRRKRANHLQDRTTLTTMKLSNPSLFLVALASASSFLAVVHPFTVPKHTAGFHRRPALVSLRATVEKASGTVSGISNQNQNKDDADSCSPISPSCDLPIFANVMAANRAEIAVRIMRAATELNAGTVAIYTHEDRYSQHRWGADRSFMLEKEPQATPISAYLDIPQIIQIAKDANVDAIHPGKNSLALTQENSFPVHQ
jgi:hypothetical protein